MQAMKEAYGPLAEWFEYLNDDCDYAAWSQYFIDGLSSLGAGSRGLELGCGSGAFCRSLVRAGYCMEGADLSPAMLMKADRLAREEGLRIPFFRADAAALRAPGKYDFVLSPNDCFNYIPPQKLPSAFKHVANALVKGGIFWLDVSSSYKLRHKVADNICADDRDDVTYLSFNTIAGEKVEMDVTLFVKRKDGAFDRFDEHHTQYIHEEEDVSAALSGAGFSPVRVEGHLGEEKEGSDRLNFICRKK